MIATATPQSAMHFTRVGHDDTIFESRQDSLPRNRCEFYILSMNFYSPSPNAVLLYVDEDLY